MVCSKQNGFPLCSSANKIRLNSFRETKFFYISISKNKIIHSRRLIHNQKHISELKNNEKVPIKALLRPFTLIPCFWKVPSVFLSYRGGEKYFAVAKYFWDWKIIFASTKIISYRKYFLATQRKCFTNKKKYFYF